MPEAWRSAHAEKESSLRRKTGNSDLPFSPRRSLGGEVLESQAASSHKHSTLGGEIPDGHLPFSDRETELCDKKYPMAGSPPQKERPHSEEKCQIANAPPQKGATSLRGEIPNGRPSSSDRRQSCVKKRHMSSSLVQTGRQLSLR